MGLEIVVSNSCQLFKFFLVSDSIVFSSQIIFVIGSNISHKFEFAVSSSGNCCLWIWLLLYLFLMESGV